MNTPDELIRREITPDERVFWSGRPQQGLIIRPMDYGTIPMGLGWCAATAAAMVFTLREGNWPFALGAAAFSLPGLYLLFGRLWTDVIQRRRTAYGITDRRILIARALPSWIAGGQVRSINLAHIAAVTLREKRGTGGTITFGARTREEAWALMAGIPGADDYNLPTFELADGARDVYTLILDAQRAASGGAPLSPSGSDTATAPAKAPPVSSLAKRQAVVAIIIVLALAAQLRWERWECLDARGNTLAGSGGLLWWWQTLTEPPIAPPGGAMMVYTQARVFPPLFSKREQPVLWPEPPRSPRA